MGMWMLRHFGPVMLLAVLCTPVPAQEADTPGLLERQRSVRERMTRLENRMLELAQLLAAREPDKAERLRDTLKMAGQRQVRDQLEALLPLLEEQSLSEADVAQEKVLADLGAMLDLLTSALNELDRLREQRERLARLKETLEGLQEKQRRLLYRTQQARQQARRMSENDTPTEPTERDPQGEAQQDGGDEQESEREELKRQIRRLEELQRELQQETQASTQEFPQAAEQDAERFPGENELEQAEQSMQEAADELEQQQAAPAEGKQQDALNQMQQALDRLEEQLRQLRQEEREETLSALEERIKAMIGQEKRVLTSTRTLQEQERDAWTKLQELQLGEARTLHSEALESMESTVRILIEEGSTIVIPDLLQEVRDDMQRVAARLERSSVEPATSLLLEDIVAALEELLAAIERQQDRDAEPQDPQQQQQQQQQANNRPLFDRSAELRLLRSAQVRINRRTDGAGEAEAEALAERQQRLAEQVRRLREAE